jgi:hypothetical protein
MKEGDMLYTPKTEITITIPVWYGVESKSSDSEWYDIEHVIASEIGIDLSKYNLIKVTVGMCERGKIPKNYNRYLDGYSITIVRK